MGHLPLIPSPGPATPAVHRVRGCAARRIKDLAFCETLVDCFKAKVGLFLTCPKILRHSLKILRRLNYCLLLFLWSSNNSIGGRPSPENPPYQGGRRAVSFGFPVPCLPQEIPRHPHHIFILRGAGPEGGMSGSPAEEVSFHLRIVAERLYPGDIFGVVIQCTKPIKQTEASFAGRKVIFYSSQDGKEWYGLAGIDLETKAGGYLIQGSLSFEDGRSEEFERPLQVRPKRFPVQHIQVDEKYVTPDPEDSKRAEEETKRLAALWKTASPEKFWQGRFLKPIASDLTSGFGRRRIVNNLPRSPHSGIDLKAQTGTPIRAANRGRVALAEDFFFSGKTVVLDHGLGLYTYYGHCSKLLVKEGELVQKGHVIAEVGSTGRVTGPHLHWACRLNEARINPMELTTHMLRD